MWPLDDETDLANCPPLPITPGMVYGRDLRVADRVFAFYPGLSPTAQALWTRGRGVHRCCHFARSRKRAIERQERMPNALRDVMLSGRLPLDSPGIESSIVEAMAVIWPGTEYVRGQGLEPYAYLPAERPFGVKPFGILAGETSFGLHRVHVFLCAGEEKGVLRVLGANLFEWVNRHASEWQVVWHLLIDGPLLTEVLDHYLDRFQPAREPGAVFWSGSHGRILYAKTWEKGVSLAQYLPPKFAKDWYAHADTFRCAAATVTHPFRVFNMTDYLQEKGSVVCTESTLQDPLHERKKAGDAGGKDAKYPKLRTHGKPMLHPGKAQDMPTQNPGHDQGRRLPVELQNEFDRLKQEWDFALSLGGPERASEAGKLLEAFKRTHGITP